jgi:general secretion pathway protein L
MAEWLLIRMASEARVNASWLVCNDQGQILLPPQSGALAQAAQMASTRRVAVVVPSDSVLLVDAQLPAKTGAKLQQIVPYALEEQLAEDIDELHFAVGERDTVVNRAPVAVVGRALLSQWLGDLREAGIAPNSMYVESSLLPSSPGQVTALLDADTLTLRLAGSAPIVMPAEPIEAAFDLLASQRMDIVEGLEPPPLGLVLYASNVDWQGRQHEFDALRDRFTGIKVQLLPSGPLALLAQQLGSTDLIDLLQGEFQPKSAGQVNWQSWRWAAVLAGALFALHVGWKSFELTRVKKAEQALDASISQVFQQAMPGQSPGGNARQQVEQRLLAIRSGQGGDGGMLGVLGALAQAKGASPAANIQGFSFREGTMELRVTAPDAAALDAVAQQLRSNGWQAELTSGNAQGEAYQGRLQIKRMGG